MVWPFHQNCSLLESLIPSQKLPHVCRCPLTSRLVKVERLRLGEDEPFAIETCYLSADEFGDLTRARLDRASLFSMLEHDHGLQIGHADEEIDATAADAHTARLLGIPAGAASTANQATDFFHEGKTHALRARPLPIRPPQAVYP